MPAAPDPAQLEGDDPLRNPSHPSVPLHGLGPLGRAAAPYLSAGVLVTSATCELWLYRLSALLRGRSAQRAVRVLQQWSRRSWRWLCLDVRVHGAPSTTPRIYVSNHRSYLDIPVLSGVLGTSFVSRADVATWPLVGAAAKAVGTVFVNRADPYARAHAARRLMRHVGKLSVVVFPEGTTTRERFPGPFHPGFFDLACRLETAIVPVTIRYSQRRAYWTDDITLPHHLLTRVLTMPPLAVAVHIGRDFESRDFSDGETLARAVHDAVCNPIAEFGELA